MPTISCDTRLYIIRDIHKIRAVSSTRPDNVILAYYVSEKLKSNNNIGLVDKHSVLKENVYALDESVYLTFTSSTFSSKFDDILVTDEYVSTASNSIAAPLFFNHALKNFTFGGTQEVMSIVIYDINMAEVTYGFTLEEDGGTGLYTGNIFNLLENKYDDFSGDLQLYYVRYVVKDGTTYTTYTELLDNSPLFHAATIDDLTGGGTLKTTAKAYIMEYSAGSYEFTLPQSTTYSYKAEDADGVRILVPENLDSDASWNVRVTTDGFARSFSGYNYVYDVPEFYNQSFYPYYPYIAAINEDALLVYPYIVKAQFGGVYYDSAEGFDIDVFIFDTNDTCLYAFTTDQDKDGTESDYGVDFSYGYIQYVDTYGGFIQLNKNLSMDYTAKVTYYHQLDTYLYPLVNFNPLHNRDIIGKKICLYCVPEATPNDNSSRSRSIYHLIIDDGDNVEYCSQRNDLSPTSTGTPDGNMNISSTVEAMTYSGFQTSYSVLSSGNLYQYLILGELSVSEAIDNDAILLFDTRVKGGGVVKEKTAEALTYYPEIQWYTDIPLPHMQPASFFVMTPYDVLDTYGGEFSEDDVVAIVDRHPAAGTYPYLKYTYDSVPSISGIYVASGLMGIYWYLQDPTDEYNFYYKEYGTNNWTKHNASPVNSLTSGVNTYVVSGLTNNKTYDVSIVTLIDSVETPKEEIVTSMVL